MVHSKRPSNHQRRQRVEIVKGSIQRFRETWQNLPYRFRRIRFIGGDFGHKADIREEAQAWFLDALLCAPSSPSEWLRDHVWPRFLAALGPATGPSEVRVESERRASFERELRAVELGQRAIQSASSAAAKPSTDSRQDLREAAESLVQWSLRFHLRGQVKSGLDVGQDSEQGWQLLAWPLLAAEETLWTWYTSPNREEMLKEDPPRWHRRIEQVDR